MCVKKKNWLKWKFFLKKKNLLVSAKKNITSDQISIRGVIKQEYEYKGMKLKRKRKEIKLRLLSAWTWWMGWEVNRSKSEQVFFFTVKFSSCVDLSKLNDVDLLTRVDLSSMTISQPRLTGRAFKYSQYFLLIRAVGHVDKWSRPASNIDYKK